MSLLLLSLSLSPSPYPFILQKEVRTTSWTNSGEDFFSLPETASEDAKWATLAHERFAFPKTPPTKEEQTLSSSRFSFQELGGRKEEEDEEEELQTDGQVFLTGLCCFSSLSVRQRTSDATCEIPG